MVTSLVKMLFFSTEACLMPFGYYTEKGLCNSIANQWNIFWTLIYSPAIGGVCLLH